MVGRWVSFWDSLFSGAMLNFGGIYIPPFFPWTHLRSLNRFKRPAAAMRAWLLGTVLLLGSARAAELEEPWCKKYENSCFSMFFFPMCFFQLSVIGVVKAKPAGLFRCSFVMICDDLVMEYMRFNLSLQSYLNRTVLSTDASHWKGGW